MAASCAFGCQGDLDLSAFQQVRDQLDTARTAPEFGVLGQSLAPASVLGYVAGSSCLQMFVGSMLVSWVGHLPQTSNIEVFFRYKPAPMNILLVEDLQLKKRQILPGINRSTDSKLC